MNNYLKLLANRCSMKLKAIRTTDITLSVKRLDTSIKTNILFQLIMGIKQNLLTTMNRKGYCQNIQKTANLYHYKSVNFHTQKYQLNLLLLLVLQAHQTLCPPVKSKLLRKPSKYRISLIFLLYMATVILFGKEEQKKFKYSTMISTIMKLLMR